jgi:hypothetical protein
VDGFGPLRQQQQCVSDHHYSGHDCTGDFGIACGEHDSMSCLAIVYDADGDGRLRWFANAYI